MIDIKLLRDEPDRIREAMARRNAQVDIESLIALDQSRRELVHESEQLRAEQNRVSEAIAAKKKARENADEEIEAMRAVRDRIKELEEAVRELDQKLRQGLLMIPNLPDASVPDGADESCNAVVRTWGEIPEFPFEPADHVDVGTRLGILDLECAAKLSGARFSLLRGAGARLERALISFFLDLHTGEHGYTEILPPFLISGETMEGSGQLPKFAEEAFKVEKRDLWLAPTAEVPLTNMHRDEILPADRLPLYYTAYTPCFRSETGSHGKDTRGMLRQHQFNKVELYKFTTPETSWDELDKLTANAERVLQLLGLPYRVVALCTGDLGFGAAKTYDLEVWLPGQNRYREISSCSNCTDFQARRAGIRYRKDKKPEYVHTLNGSGLAVGRTVVAILENCQQEDGSVVIPEALRPYMGGLDRIAPQA